MIVNLPFLLGSLDQSFTFSNSLKIIIFHDNLDIVVLKEVMGGSKSFMYLKFNLLFIGLNLISQRQLPVSLVLISVLLGFI